MSWDFGDSTTGTGNDPSHTYADSGSYTVCVTTHTSCGDDISCQAIHVAVAADVTNIYGSNIKLYPNPINEMLYIENATVGTAVKIYNVVGQQVYNGSVTGNNQAIDMSGFTSGTYLLRLTDTNGNGYAQTIIKQQ